MREKRVSENEFLGIKIHCSSSEHYSEFKSFCSLNMIALNRIPELYSAPHLAAYISIFMYPYHFHKDLKSACRALPIPRVDWSGGNEKFSLCFSLENLWNIHTLDQGMPLNIKALRYYYQISLAIPLSVLLKYLTCQTSEVGI